MQQPGIEHNTSNHSCFQLQKLVLVLGAILIFLQNLGTPIFWGMGETDGCKTYKTILILCFSYV